MKSIIEVISNRYDSETFDKSFQKLIFKDSKKNTRLKYFQLDSQLFINRHYARNIDFYSHIEYKRK